MRLKTGLKAGCGANGANMFNAFFNSRGGTWWNEDGELDVDEDLAADTLQFMLDLDQVRQRRQGRSAPLSTQACVAPWQRGKEAHGSTLHAVSLSTSG
jgi:hypothetical protein